jgi:acyl carrier protein
VSQPERTLVLGGAGQAHLLQRVGLLKARARAACELGKPWEAFWRESGRDWVDAPWRVLVQAAGYEELQQGLEEARRDLSGEASLALSAQVRIEKLGVLAEPAGPTAHPLDSGSLPGSARLPREGAAPEDLSAKALWLTSELTGYSLQELGLEKDLRSELGLDSLKRAQIIQALWDRCGLPWEEDLQVDQFPTLGHMVFYLTEQAGQGFGPRAASEGALPPAALEGLPAPPSPAAPGEDLGSRLSAVRVELMAPGAQDASPPPAEVHHPLGPPGQLDPEPVTSWWRKRLGGVETTLEHVVGALMLQFLHEVVQEGAPAPPGPRLYLSNHQTALESYLFPLLAAALDGLPLEGVAMLDHGVEWADPMRDFLVAHQDIPVDLVAPVRGVPSGDARALLRLVPELESDLAGGRWSLHLAVEGARERQARYRLRELSMVWLDLALKLGLPVVPVRFLGGLPLEDPGHAQDLPLDFGSQSIFFGTPILPAELAELAPQARRERVLEALNALGSPADEVPHPADLEFAHLVGHWIEFSGCAGIAAVVLACLERSRPFREDASALAPRVMTHPSDGIVATAFLARAGAPGPLALVLPDTADGRWAATLAGMAFGERGPKVFVGAPPPEGFTTLVQVEPGRPCPGLHLPN